LGPVGAAPPARRRVRAPAPPSREEDENDDDVYDSDQPVKISGISLREEVFEVLEEIVEGLAGRGLSDVLGDIRTSLADLRAACIVKDLVALVKGLTTISRAHDSEFVNMLIVV
jgi:hypothetical protein